MTRNIELKATCGDLAGAGRTAAGIGARLCAIERQQDTYFDVKTGRLKLRRRWPETADHPSDGPTTGVS